MVRALILLHRWLSVAFCLLFAMWFASGIVMHFVPFPAMTEAERFAGLAELDLAGLDHGPADAVAASGIKNATRVRLLQRPDGPAYLVSGVLGEIALHADDLTAAAVHSKKLALAIAMDYARRRQLAGSAAEVEGLFAYDQWTVSGVYHAYRPLYRVALNDSLGTELYVSSTTGEIVLSTTRRERGWNYVGSVAHWIYPTALRSHPAAWSTLVWWVALLALIGATAGAVVGTLRIGKCRSRPLSPYSGLQAWHHLLGLACMLFVLSWIFSGWLSMDDGQLFSTGRPTHVEAAAITGTPTWNAVPRDEVQRVSGMAKEVEWFVFGGRTYRRERVSLDRQRLFLAGAPPGPGIADRAFLRPEEIDRAASHLASACNPAVAVDSGDDYAVTSTTPNAPVFRATCGDVWFHIDGANGALLKKLDRSQRAYRWLYGALHTLDFPVLTARPALRATLIVVLCGCGLVFSLTGVVMAWRRLLSSVGLAEKR
jgi:PepSY-associated TM region